ncbi:hypothetical protein RRG08_026864 [Elysia crispata]|uniref:Dermatopontin n=1 Tax=Elysia crispata TaxID=231223 RepID=A0AAE0Y5P7_9GAST|nr:hypothetical protein RRG08_026864 [Elysia crispata]
MTANTQYKFVIALAINVSGTPTKSSFHQTAMGKKFFGPLPFLLSTLLAVALLGDGVDSCIDSDAPFNFTCPIGLVLNQLNSVHNKQRNERTWSFGCAAAPNEANPTDCHWTMDYVNKWHEDLMFKCVPNYVIAGFVSCFSNDKADKRFKFKCCSHSGYTYTLCDEETTDYINESGATLDCIVPSGKVLTGLISMYDTDTKDRRWSFTFHGYSPN